MIDLTVDGRGVARLVLDRPEKHNALSRGLIDALTASAAEIAARDDIRVVVLSGAGASFCAGGDLRWMQEQMQGDDAMREDAATALANMLGALDRLPQPLIGRVHGNALGGGVGLACVCDIVLATDTARFGLTEVRLGLIPATIAPYVLARMGAAHARQVFMSGRVFDATEAARLGIVARVVPPETLDDAISAEVAPYLDAAPSAVAAAKRLTRMHTPKIEDAEIARSVAALVAQWRSDEAKEGISAFFEGRKPFWSRD